MFVPEFIDIKWTPHESIGWVVFVKFKCILNKNESFSQFSILFFESKTFIHIATSYVETQSVRDTFVLGGPNQLILITYACKQDEIWNWI